MLFAISILTIDLIEKCVSMWNHVRFCYLAILRLHRQQI